MTHYVQLPKQSAWSHMERVLPEDRQQARSVAFTFVHYQHEPARHHRVKDAGRAALAITEFLGMLGFVLWLIWRATS